MIAETLFCAELLRPMRTQKFRDHAIGLPRSMVSHAAGWRPAGAARHDREDFSCREDFLCYGLTLSGISVFGCL